MATTTVFLPGEVHEQRRLAGYSPWGHKESELDSAERTHTQTHTHNVLVLWDRRVLHGVGDLQAGLHPTRGFPLAPSPHLSPSLPEMPAPERGSR